MELNLQHIECGPHLTDIVHFISIGEVDIAWLDGVIGKVVKIIAALRVALPDSFPYDVTMMRRGMGELLASQQKMLERRGVTENQISDETMAASFEKNLQRTYAWLQERGNLHHIDVPYDELVIDTHTHISREVDFLGGDLDNQAMAELVSPELYRQRKKYRVTCLLGFNTNVTLIIAMRRCPIILYIFIFFGERDGEKVTSSGHRPGRGHQFGCDRFDVSGVAMV